MRKLFTLGSFYIAVFKRVLELRRASKKATAAREEESLYKYTETGLPAPVK